MKKPKAIYSRNSHSYVTYDNPDTANIINERFYLEKKLFGIRIYKKTWNQDSTLMDRRAVKRTGFK